MLIILYSSTVCRDHEGLGFLALKSGLQTSQIYLFCDSRAVLVRHSQAQKCLQIFTLSCYEILKFSKNFLY